MLGEIALKKQYLRFFLLTSLLTSVVIFYFEIFLTWDASYQLMTLIQTRELYWMGGRYVMIIFQLPLYLYLNFFGGESLNTMIFLFGIPYSFYPFVCCFGIYRLIGVIDPHLSKLLMISSTLASFVFFFHPLFEQLIGFCFFYLLVAAFRNYLGTQSKTTAVLIVVFEFFVAFSHPVVLPCLLLSWVFLIFLGREKRNWFLNLQMVVLPTLVLIEIVITFIFHTRKTSSEYLKQYFLGSFSHFPQIERELFLVAMFVLVASSVVTLVTNKKKIGFGLFILSQVFFHYWLMVSSQSLRTILDLRFTLFLFHVPYLTMIFVPVRLQVSKYYLILTGFSLFLLILHMGILRKEHRQRVYAKVEASQESCLKVEDVAGRRASSLEHWSLWYDYILYRRLKNVDKIIINFEKTCGSAVIDDQFEASSGESFPRSGFFEIALPQQ